MNVISEKIKYLPAANDPLSADVYFIEGDKYCYLYDVGNNEHSLRCINQLDKEKVIVVSHYHEDHTGNIDRVHAHNLYVGRETFTCIGRGQIIEEPFTIMDGVKLEIIPCPSPHTEGSLVINIDNEYTLIADLYFSRPPFNIKKALMMIETLKNIDTKYFVISHQEEEKIVPKKRLISELLNYFTQ